MEGQEHQLTERQQGILRYIWQFSQSRGYPPSLREIGDAVGVRSTSVVNYNLERLESKGLLERDRRYSRGLRLSDRALALFSNVETLSRVVTVPFLGFIVAGEPAPIPSSDFTLTGPDETVELAQGMLPNVRDLYALEVRGDSMVDALVRDGDIVIMRYTERVENGEMAAVWLRDRQETTLKRVYWEGNRVRLQPANPTMGPIYIDDPAQVEVRGRVMMVIRRLQ